MLYVMHGIEIFSEDVGGSVPYITPTKTYDGFMEFDRTVCASGLKKYARPAMNSDYPPAGVSPGIEENDTVIVTEQREGVRLREFAKLIRGENN